MAKQVSFQNPGIIDPRAYRIIGASAKTGSNPIGFFGTGLKYAIAIFLRLGCTVELYHGLERVTFGTVDIEMRDSKFKVITVCREGREPEELGYTTEFGKTWQPWQALRELWCNALDEDGDMQPIRLDPEEGATTIVVTGQAVMDAYYEREKIMLTTTPRLISQGVEIHEKRGRDIYFRGVRVQELNAPCVLTYNIVGKPVELTEDRTMRYPWTVNTYVRDAIMACTDEGTLRLFMNAGEGSWEYSMDMSDGEPGETFTRVLEEVMSLKHKCNPSLMRLYFKKHGKEHDIEEIEPTAQERQMLARATAFCRDLGLSVDAFPVKFVDTLDGNLLGMADRKQMTIYITRRACMKGTKIVAGTLMEELVHLQYRLDDESRPLQDYLVDFVVTLWEQKTGAPL